jgi:exopolysaccharide production protein ExoY
MVNHMYQGHHFERQPDRRPPVQATGLRALVSNPARVIDVLIAGSAILFLLPMLLLIAACIYCLDPGPILFGQKRIGLRGEMFRCYKFRSMCIDAEQRLVDLLYASPEARAEWERDQKLRNDPRITSIGWFLRKSSLDELPQLLNVVMGHMSLVGPRPIVEAEASRYGRYIAHYCSVRPGITGLWQVSGRNDVQYRRRVAMDVVYSRSRNMSMDFRILMMTVPSVMLSRGTY